MLSDLSVCWQCSAAGGGPYDCSKRSSFEAVGKWSLTGNLKHSHGFQKARAGRVSMGTFDEMSGSCWSHCYILCPGGDDYVILRALEMLGDPAAVGQM